MRGLFGVRIIGCADYQCTDCPVCELSGAWFVRCADCPVCGLSGARFTQCADCPVRGLSMHDRKLLMTNDGGEE